MSNILANYFNQIILTLLLALAAFLGGQVKNLYQKYVTTEIKKSVCRTAVRFVEQIYIDLHGRDKLKKAMKKASELLAEKGITISDNELEAMLEAAVNEFNKSFSKTDPEVKAKDELEKTYGALDCFP
jgi:intergrase/recombinase